MGVMGLYNKHRDILRHASWEGSPLNVLNSQPLPPPLEVGTRRNTKVLPGCTTRESPHSDTIAPKLTSWTALRLHLKAAA